MIAEYEQEVKFLEKVRRDQGKDLVVNAVRDNAPYIQALESENNKLKKDKNQMHTAFNQAIKE